MTDITSPHERERARFEASALNRFAADRVPRIVSVGAPREGEYESSYWQLAWEFWRAGAKADTPSAPLVAEGAEPAAWQVWWGLLEMRPHWPPFKTKNEADTRAATIKCNTEVRPLYAASCAGLTKPSHPSHLVALAKGAWNATADACNQWPELSEDEKLEAVAEYVAKQGSR